MEEQERSQIISDRDLAQYAGNIADTLLRDGTLSARKVCHRVRLLQKQIERFHTRAVEWAAGRAQVPQAVEWLLDNWYLAQREALDSAAAFRRAGRLPAVKREGRIPTVLALACAFVGAGPLTRERLAVFLAGVQQTGPLTEKELSLFVPALKGALLECLEKLCGDLRPLLDRQTALSKQRLDEEQFLDWEQVQLAKAMEDVFKGLRLLSNTNLGPMLEEASCVEQFLRKDPSGDYSNMDDESRTRYRREVCRLARNAGLSEAETARRILALAEQGKGPHRHVGWYIFREPLGKRRRIRNGAVYVAAVMLPTLFIVLLAGFLLNDPAVVLLLLLPVSDIVKNAVDFLCVRLFQPRYVHRMGLKGGVPDNGRTLCVITALLTGKDSGRELATLLERYRFANRDAGNNLLFGILADLPDSGLPMGSAAAEYLSAAQKAVESLNEKYGGGFYLFFRRPVFQPRDERYMGWERKRGALLELARLLRGRHTGLKVEAGEKESLSKVRYVITLDSDTRLNVGVARELIGAMLHPLNRPEVDLTRRIVTSGYGVLQPRVGIELEAANRSQFSRIFAGQGGVDPYGSAASDVYHDLFDQGTYTGKGIFDVDAFLLCLEGRLPTNRILSHDLLEGSYLRAGLISDVELTDGYPYKVTNYFSRLHRWVRGDWQLLPWLGRRVPDESGDKVPNPVSAIAKWKIFDNLRRSLSPICTLLALLLGMCVSGSAFAAAAAAAVLAAASNLLLSGADLALRFGQGVKTRYHSTIIAGFGGVILQTVVQLLFLPYNAWTCFSAIVTALWRMLISHRGLLAWVTAADAERRQGNGIPGNYRKQWFSVAAGAVAMACAALPAGAAVGLVWVLSPLFAWALSRPINTRPTISETDRAFLLHEGGLIWRYFADHLQAEDHWLPPDNDQIQPPVGVARRTSPTNIGMALLSVLAAADLEFLSREKAAKLLGHMLDTLEGLPKWRGHLYNWYDTAKAEPLAPRYVSTVDSGNLCGCLIALREGLYEWGKGDLARRAEKLSDAMDFSLLYDRERKLFYIGYDVEEERYTQGWYDLMASEARQTSYIAVARGQVPPRHWRQLSRMLVKDNDYTGMASWTGTMFEYFMPNLLLPCEPNSLMYESLAFCVYAQRRRAGKRKTPWGISESCFYAFDAGMSYQYKAHGVQKLGLKRGLDTELVISPYSSFLALLLLPGSAAKNLRRMRDMGLEGKYGLYEAADFTPERLTGERRWEPVCTFMAHHLGMSLVAIDNALMGNIMQERFMRDCSMVAFRELLQEKVPVGAAISRPEQREIPEKPRRNVRSRFFREGEGFCDSRPACHLVSDGSYTVLCTDSGITDSHFGKTAVTLAHLRGVEKPSGVSFFFRRANGVLWPLTAAPLYQNVCKYAWTFTGDSAKWTAETGNFRAESAVRAAGGNGELREVLLTWQGEETLEGELVCYLEPVLASSQDYIAHPAFLKLSVESRFLGNGVLFTRRARERAAKKALSVLWDGSCTGFDTSRETALGRGGLRALGQALERPARETVGAILDPCLLVRFPVRLNKGEHCRFRLALGIAGQAEDAVLNAQRLLHLPKSGALGRLDGLMRVCDISPDKALEAFRLLEALLYPAERATEQSSTLSQEGLWPFGISGDLPIAVAEQVDQNNAEKAFDFIRQHRFLSRCGAAFDLVLLLQEGGDYRRPFYRMILEELKRLGEEQRLGRKGGVYLIEAAKAAVGPILAAAAVSLCPKGLSAPPSEKTHPVRRLPTVMLLPGQPEYSTGTGGSIRLRTGGTLPPVGWNQILCNRDFGWMTDETGCGHLWYKTPERIL